MIKVVNELRKISVEWKLIESKLGESEEGRPVKVYRLTPKGRKALEQERQSWRRFSEAVEAVLAAT